MWFSRAVAFSVWVRAARRALFPVIRMTPDEGGRAVELFRQNDAHQRVGQGQCGQAEHQIGRVPDALVQAVRAADDEAQIAALPHPRLQPMRELDGGERLAALVQGYFYTAARDRGKDSRAFLASGPRALRRAVGVAPSRPDLGENDRKLARHAPGIVLEARRHPGGRLAADGE